MAVGSNTGSVLIHLSASLHHRSLWRWVDGPEPPALNDNVRYSAWHKPHPYLLDGEIIFLCRAVRTGDSCMEIETEGLAAQEGTVWSHFTRAGSGSWQFRWPSGSTFDGLSLSLSRGQVGAAQRPEHI